MLAVSAGMDCAQYLSFDCANKTLGWCIVEIRDMTDILHTLDTIIALIGVATPVEILAAIKGVTRAIRSAVRLDCGVNDLLKGKRVADVSDLDRTRALRAFLDELGARHRVTPDTIIVIEHQPPKVGIASNTTTGAAMVEHQLLMYYSAHQVRLASPKLKNNIRLSPELDIGLYFAQVGARFRDKTDARKVHAADSLRYFTTRFGISVAHINKSQLNHAGDAFLLMWAERAIARDEVGPSPS